MANRDRELTPGLVSRWKRMNNVEQLRCYRCGRELEIGDLLQVKYGGSVIPSMEPCRYRIPRYARIYHQSCFEEMFLEC